MASAHTTPLISAHYLRIPPVLSRLSLLERILVTRRFHVALQCVISAPSPSLPGGVSLSAVALPTAEGYSVQSDTLPLTPETLSNVLIIRPLPNHSNSEAFRLCTRVRKAFVFEAIIWIRAHNSFYSSVTIDYESLNNLPLDGHPLMSAGIFRWKPYFKTLPASVRVAHLVLMATQPNDVLAECFPIIFHQGQGSLQVIFGNFAANETALMSEDPRFFIMVLWAIGYSFIPSH